MKQFVSIGTVLILGLGSLVGWAMTNEGKPFAPNVDPKTGAISVPENYREWPTLGTWAHAKVEGAPSRTQSSFTTRKAGFPTEGCW